MIEEQEAKKDKKEVKNELEEVFFNKPNLIGYFRVLTAIISFLMMKKHPVLTVIFYGISGFLDGFDGYVARRFNQKTLFGACLDMVVDRCSTLSITIFLSRIYGEYYFIWQILASLDLSLHYIFMYAMTLKGDSHKNVDSKQLRFLSIYYRNRMVLFIVCLFNEMMYVGLYLMHFGYFWTGLSMIYLSLPFWLFKQFANIVQIKNASILLAYHDAEEKRKD